MLWALVATTVIFSLFTSEILRTLKTSVLTGTTLVLSLIFYMKKSWVQIKDLDSQGVSPKELARNYLSFKLRDLVKRFLGFGFLEKSSSDCYNVKYFEGGSEYIIVFPKNRKVRQIVKVEDIYLEDVTDLFLKMMGPCHNFHGIVTTPKMLGWKDGLRVHYRNKTINFFEGSKEIVLHNN